MASLNKLKRGTTPTPPPNASSMLEEHKRRRAERKERLLNNSQAYVNNVMSGFPPLPTEQEAVDFSFDGLNELEEEGMTQVSGNSDESTNSTAWQKIARQQSNMANKTQTMPIVNRNPIVNAAANTYNPLGGSCYSQPQQGYGAAMFGMGGIYGSPIPMMSQEQAEEIRKAQEARIDTEKNYLRGTLMWGRPENVSVEDWTKHVDEMMRQMYPSPEDLQKKRYEQDHSFMGYKYDENFQRVEESGVSIVVIMDDGEERLMSEPNDPETGKHKIVYTKSYDVAEYQSRLHFFDNCYRSAYEQQRAKYIFDVVCAPPAEALASTYKSKMELGVDDPYMKWVYNTYYLKDYKRHMTRWKAGCYMSPKEYTQSFYMSGIDPNIRFDMNTLPTHLGDRRDVKLAYDYQQHPDLFNGPQVEQYLTNKLKVNYEMRKRAFLEKLRTGDMRVNYNPPEKDTDPCPPIVGTAPIAPDANGVIRDMYGKPLFDPTKDLATQLTPEQQDALTEYNVNARLAQYKAMGEEV